MVRGPIRDAVSIELRPKDIEQRLYVEDWKVDAVLGKPETFCCSIYSFF